jgi:hypothetical protein
MPPPRPSQRLLPLELPSPAEAWIKRLSDALDDPSRGSGFLELAKQALEACPANGVVLRLAAVSALLDQQPENAHLFLKRLRKLHRSGPTEQLLQALALFQSNKSYAARVLLERHGMTQRWDAWRVFPTGQARFRWLADQINAIMGRIDPYRRPAPAKKKRPARKPTEPAGQARIAHRSRTATPAPVEPASSLPPLRQVAIEIPFTVELDLTPLSSMRSRAPERGGTWWRLRERFAHLGLERLHLTDPAGQAACRSCGKAWCRACHGKCPRCGSGP